MNLSSPTNAHSLWQYVRQRDAFWLVAAVNLHRCMVSLPELCKISDLSFTRASFLVSCENVKETMVSEGLAYAYKGGAKLPCGTIWPTEWTGRFSWYSQYFNIELSRNNKIPLLLFFLNFFLLSSLRNSFFFFQPSYRPFALSPYLSSAFSVRRGRNIACASSIHINQKSTTSSPLLKVTDPNNLRPITRAPYFYCRRTSKSTMLSNFWTSGKWQLVMDQGPLLTPWTPLQFSAYYPPWPLRRNGRRGCPRQSTSQETTSSRWPRKPKTPSIIRRHLPWLSGQLQRKCFALCLRVKLHVRGGQTWGVCIYIYILTF